MVCALKMIVNMFNKIKIAKASITFINILDLIPTIFRTIFIKFFYK